MSDDKPTIEAASIRRDYRLGLLTESEAAADPFTQFSRWFDDAVAAGILDPNAMTLATVDAAGQPSARIVLMKGFDHTGFTFFTNYDSRKGRELSANPRASLVFFWPILERQVRIDGSVTKTTRAESEAYFHQRPFKSQIGAAASAQSRVVANRAELEKLFAELTDRYASKQVPTPSTWGGYRLSPSAVEFWQGRQSRLHDRLLYTPMGAGWKIERLSP